MSAVRYFKTTRPEPPVPPATDGLPPPQPPPVLVSPFFPEPEPPPFPSADGVPP